MTSKRIAVIGAGVSGLVTIKELLEQGHEPVCFEQAGSLGGVFRFGEQDGVVWQSCRLTSSGLLTAFSDFPVSGKRADHMHIGEFVKYLTEYCETFGLARHIRYDHRVEAVTKGPNGTWTIQSACEGNRSVERYDAVAVCSGLHQYPHVPHFPGQETFTGQILHASRYRRDDQVRGKKVLIVGAGESGADITAEVAEHAAETVLSLRRGVAVVSRRAFGMPRDYLTSRLMNSTSHWVFQTRNPADNRKRSIYRYMFLPLVVIDKCLQILYRQVWENLPMFFSLRLRDVKNNLRTRKLTMQLLEESGLTVSEQFGTKDDCFVRALAAGKCRRVPAIRRFDGGRVIFEDGTGFEPDLVLFCTGFETKMPFLDIAIASAPRYLNTFTPEIGESLGFIGFVRPAFGAIPPLSELQARWFALVQSGEITLPARDRMKESIEWWAAVRKHIFRASAERLEHLVDFTVYCDELATRIGCKPGKQDLKRESRGFRKRFYSGPFVAAQYRLTGPNAKPELARATIEGLPILHPWPDRLNLFLRWQMCKTLHRIFGPEFAPKLTIG